MLMQTTSPTLPVDQGNSHPNPTAPPAAAPLQADFFVPDELVKEVSAAPPPESHLEVESARPRNSSYFSPYGTPSAARRRIVIGALVLVILVSLAGFGGYLSGARARGSADPAGAVGAADHEKTRAEKKDLAAVKGVSLVAGKPHTIEVPEGVRITLGMLRGDQQVVATAQAPAEMRPLVFPGSTALDPIRLARIRARFAPARVVQIGQIQDYSPQEGKYEVRELRPGDRVTKGQVLGIFYSVDVGSKKNDLLDALTQLILDQKIYDNANSEKYRAAIPQVFLDTAWRQVQTDRNQVDRALHNLEAWDIPQDEIDALREEAKKQAADEKEWKKTREGTWVTGGKVADADKVDPETLAKNPWGKVALRAPFDGVIVERNVHVDELVVDNTINLFQIAQVKKLLVVANCPEDQLPVVLALEPGNRRWNVRTAGADSSAGLPGSIDEIGYLIDPNQHTAVIKGYVDNPGEQLRAGQFISATVPIPPPAGVVEIPLTALMDDGQQSIVFVQPDAAKAEYTMRRVQVTNRFDNRAFVRSTPLPKEEQLTAREAEEGCLPREPLQPGDRIINTAVGELKAALYVLESQRK
jgi:cobalt-zinc-cadmium efflux system membrane fusion protein